MMFLSGRGVGYGGEMQNNSHAAPPQIVTRNHQTSHHAKRARRVCWAMYRDISASSTAGWDGLSRNLEVGTGKGVPNLKQPGAGGEVISQCNLRRRGYAPNYPQGQKSIIKLIKLSVCLNSETPSPPLNLRRNPACVCLRHTP